MGNSLISNVALDNKFLSFFSNIEYVIYGVLSLLFTAIIVFILSIVFKKVRRRFPLKVNCWFCNEYTTIPYELSNCWDCPNCKQYNGFSKDGDYNRIIPEQFNSKLNEGVYKILKASVKSKENTIQTNGFCKLCNINQQLKIQQLALFVPFNENNYDEEIEEYRQKLEKAYQLCSKCEITLKQTLEKQDYNLLQNRLNSYKTHTLVGEPKKLSRFDSKKILIIIKKSGLLVLRLISITLAISLFFALIIDFETEYQFLNKSLPDFGLLEPLLPILEMLLLFRDQVCYFKKEISFFGLLSCFSTFFENPMKKSVIISLAWVFLNLSCWTSFSGLQLILSGACFLLSLKRTQNNFIYTYKKSRFQSVKKVFPEIYNNKLREENDQLNKMPSPLLRRDSIGSLDECTDLFDNNKIKGAKQKSKNIPDIEEKKKKTRQKENEIESVMNEEREVTSPNSSPNSSFTEKSFLLSTEGEKSCPESNGPFNEVFNNLSSLQLGTQKKSNKPPNFLFANHNFSEVKNSSSIIKPAKFIKNFNSNSWTESNECNSRSSTPSSGYSSQKPEKVEPHRNDFQKTMTPVFMNPFGRQSPTNYFDYYDGNHGFYNNFNCFSPGFVPFQQYPGPMGHTAVYTSSRPTNFPFFFSPWQGYSPQKFSPASSRFSDASDCDNLFQESSKRFEKSQRVNYKTVLYYFSIFCNFATMASLAYFISTGIILVDWKLPKFNFFM